MFLSPRIGGAVLDHAVPGKAQADSVADASSQAQEPPRLPGKSSLVIETGES